MKSLKDYTIHQRVGAGAQGVVYRATSLDDGRTVAIKQIDIAMLGAKERAAALAEVQVLQTLRDEPHPCIMRYIDSFIDECLLCIVLDWCSGGNLMDYYEKHRARSASDKPQLGEDAIWHFVLSIASALRHCHARGILHRDVKMANVFLHNVPGKALPQVQLGDFGVSCILADKSRAQTVVGTPYYLSPELCQGQAYDAKSDMWSLGVLVFQLCNEKMPYEASNYAALILRIVQQTHAKQTFHYSPILHRIASWCMQKDPNARPTAEQLLECKQCAIAAVRIGLLVPGVAGVSAEATQKRAAPEPPQSAALPLARRPATSTRGAIPSRRVRNRHAQGSGSGTAAPPTVSGPQPGATRAQAPQLRTMERGATRNAAAGGQPTERPESGSSRRPKQSEANRRRDISAVASLPDYTGTDSDDGAADHSVSPSNCGDGSPTRADEQPVCNPPLAADDEHGGGSNASAAEDQPSADGGSADDVDDEPQFAVHDDADDSPTPCMMTWCVDGESGTVEPVMESIHAVSDAGAATLMRTEDREDIPEELDGTSSSLQTTITPEVIHAQLQELQDEAEQLVGPSDFLRIVDALQQGDRGVDALVRGATASDDDAAELTYLCFRWVFLNGELRASQRD